MARVTAALLCAAIVLVFSAENQDATFELFKVSVSTTITQCASLSIGTTADQVCASERSRMLNAGLTSACTSRVEYTTCMNSNCNATQGLRAALESLKNICDTRSPVTTSVNPPTTTVEMSSNNTTGSPTTPTGAGVSLTRSLAIRSLTLISVCTSLALVLK